VKDKKLEPDRSTKEKASKTTRVAKEMLGFTLQTPRIRHMRQQNMRKRKPLRLQQLPRNL
jgi:hypothetical protein